VNFVERSWSRCRPDAEHTSPVPRYGINVTGNGAADGENGIASRDVGVLRRVTLPPAQRSRRKSHLSLWIDVQCFESCSCVAGTR